MDYDDTRSEFLEHDPRGLRSDMIMILEHDPRGLRSDTIMILEHDPHGS